MQLKRLDTSVLCIKIAIRVYSFSRKREFTDKRLATTGENNGLPEIEAVISHGEIESLNMIFKITNLMPESCWQPIFEILDGDI